MIATANCKYCLEKSYIIRMKLSLSVVVVLCFLVFKKVSLIQQHNEYIITTDYTNSQHCQNCLTLTQFALNVSHYLNRNTTLILQPGNHTLHSSILVSNVHTFTLYHEAHHGSSLKCEQSSKLLFDSVRKVNISNLNLTECFNNKVLRVNNLVMSNLSFYGSFFVTSGTALELVESSAILSNCFFTKYYYGTYRSLLTFSYKHFETVIHLNSKRIGGAMVVNHSNVSIYHSNFTENRAQLGGAIYAENGSNVNISATSFVFNTANSSYYDPEEVAAGGALYAAYSCSITVFDSYFDKNEVYFGYRIGGTLTLFRSNLFITGSVFTRSRAEYGGVAFLLESTAKFQDNKINSSTAFNNGGVLFTVNSFLTLHNNDAAGNLAHLAAGVVYLAGKSELLIQQCNFSDNVGIVDGGVIYSKKNNSVFVNSSTFTNNVADHGAVIYINNAVVHIHHSYFVSNRAQYEGGVCYISKPFNSVRISQSSFLNNTAYTNGGVLYSKSKNTILDTNNRFIANRANQGGVMYTHNNQLISKDSYIARNSVKEQGVVLLIETNARYSGETTFYKNIGSSLIMTDSEISLTDNINFIENVISDTNMNGGAINCFQSFIIFNGTIVFHKNIAYRGGAIYSIDSKFFAYGSITLSNNGAFEGGGLYLYQSELTCRESVIFIENHANKSGGGIQSLNSFIRLSHRGSLLFMRNHAKLGGGTFLTSNSKITIIHQGYTTYMWDLRIRLLNNSADFGGGIFVDDEANSKSCDASNFSNVSTGDDCFLQTGTLFGNGEKFQFLLVNANKAVKAGADIYGGMLDRCRPHPLYSTGQTLKYLQKISNIRNLTSISSRPVRVCYCRQNRHDCDYAPGTMNVTRGRDFEVQVVALDQVNSTINATILAYSSGSSGIGEGQHNQHTYSACTNLTYRVYSKYPSETLTLYADGPCKDNGISSLFVHVQFLPCICPIGFTMSLDSPSICRCVCDDLLRPYLTRCNASSHLLLRESNVWINTIEMHGYLVYPHCPFDYCMSPSIPVYINLSQIDGADAQCSFNRAGVLCGACKPSFSLALGSSRCLQCTTNWLILLIPFSLMGLALVAFVLILNLTVSRGTVISIVFFSNIVIANRAILIPLKNYNFLVTFLSWFSLDLGVETCFANGLDSYAKAWLQFLFPIYIFTIILVIIIISQYSKKFSNIIGGCNPIATLATLIWFSNAKLFRTVISAVSFTVLDYPNNIPVLVWFPDGNIRYLTGKHIPLFLASLLILIIAILYILVLLSWQWLLCLPKCKILYWTRNTRLISLMDAYHAPFKDKHRYWPGLLLLVSMIQYFVSGFTITGNPAIGLFSIIILVTTLTVYKSFVFGVYKKWPLDCLETTIQFNLTLLASATLYVMNTNGNQAALANISLSIVFITFIFVIGYHLTILIFGDNYKNVFNWLKLRSDHSTDLITNDYREAASLKLFEY